MRNIIKKILRESTLNQNIANKVYNHIKDDFWFEYNRNYSDGQVVTNFHTPDGEQIKGTGGGISYQIGDGSPLVVNIVPILLNTFGLSIDEALFLWGKIRFDLAKDRFIHSLPWGLYEEYIQYQEDPYRVDTSNEVGYDYSMEGTPINDVFNLRKLEDLKKFVEWVGWGRNEGAAHYDERYNFLETMTTNDYELLQKDLLDYIKRDSHL